MENVLKRLFDYQKFEGNKNLQRVIDGVENRYATRELNLDEMEWVAAAGDIQIQEKDPFKQDVNKKADPER